MKRILIVDDEQVLADCLREEFEFLGHEVTVINDSSEAASALFTESFDIILLDIKMPKVNGVELFEQIKPHTDAKIVFLSAISDMMSHDPALQKADMILEKPFSVEDIKKIVDLAK
ncbi:response regulator [Halobacteriovorax marinus]|uniref:response regulator n=1 Tax=Halobacteriovorax marinus TaxID=97084 RepID=UPI003A93AC1B